MITALIGSALTAAVTVLRSPMGQVSQQVTSDTLRVLFFGLLVALVVITSALGKPKRRATTTDFPPPLGAKLIVWACLAVWMVLLFAPLTLGMYWLAALSISESRDVLVLKGQNGDKIKISTVQVGADELFAEIRRHTRIDIRPL